MIEKIKFVYTTFVLQKYLKIREHKNASKLLNRHGRPEVILFIKII